MGVVVLTCNPQKAIVPSCAQPMSLILERSRRVEGCHEPVTVLDYGLTRNVKPALGRTWCLFCLHP